MYYMTSLTDNWRETVITALRAYIAGALGFLRVSLRSSVESVGCATGARGSRARSYHLYDDLISISMRSRDSANRIVHARTKDGPTRLVVARTVNVHVRREKEKPLIVKTEKHVSTERVIVLHCSPWTVGYCTMYYSNLLTSRALGRNMNVRSKEKYQKHRLIHHKLGPVN